MMNLAKPNVAVLVLNLNGAHFLEDCFRSIFENTSCPFDVYLIDNGSTDASVQFTRDQYPRVSIVENQTNLGFTGAYDKVIRCLDYEYVVLLNNDTIVQEGWLDALVSAVERDSRIGACGSKILMAKDGITIDHAGGMLTIIGSGLDRGKWTKDDGRYDTAEEVGFGCGCSLLVRRSAYLEVGGFYPDYVIYHEDVDLCWKMRLFGYSIWYVPESVLHHHMGGGVIQSVEHPFKAYLCQKNRLANIIVNSVAKRLLPAILISTCYDFVRVIRFMFTRRWDLLKVLLKAYIVTFRDLRILRARRKFVQAARLISDEECQPFFAPFISSALEYFRLLRPRS